MSTTYVVEISLTERIKILTGTVINYKGNFTYECKSGEAAKDVYKTAVLAVEMIKNEQ